jgi:murein DD-endopeptidase MepM/ murein hydrolase activator NlpD
MREAATQIEALFLSTLLKEVRKSAPDDLMGGNSVGVWSDLLDQELAGRMAEGGQLGLRDNILLAMGFSPDTEAVPAPAGASRGVGVLTAGRVTSGYGWRSDPMHGKQRFHGGIDIGAPEGTPFFAARDGTVTFAGRAGGYGNLVVVAHADGSESRYAHARDLANVRPGDVVKAGDRLGSVGSTGRSTGPHLHFEVRQGGKAVDPSPWLRATAPEGHPVAPEGDADHEHPAGRDDAEVVPARASRAYQAAGAAMSATDAARSGPEAAGLSNVDLPSSVLPSPTDGRRR